MKKQHQTKNNLVKVIFFIKTQVYLTIFLTHSLEFGVLRGLINSIFFFAQVSHNARNKIQKKTFKQIHKDQNINVANSFAKTLLRHVTI